MADYKDKIRKLLALAQSPEEAEAKAALLRARELMAQHKLTEADLEEAKKQAVRDVKTDITCSKRRDPWIVGLSAVIGEHYCRRRYRRPPSASEKRISKPGRRTPSTPAPTRRGTRRARSSTRPTGSERGWRHDTRAAGGAYFQGL